MQMGPIYICAAPEAMLVCVVVCVNVYIHRLICIYIHAYMQIGSLYEQRRRPCSYACVCVCVCAYSGSMRPTPPLLRLYTTEILLVAAFV